MSEFIERPRRIKGSGDHNWAEWSDTPLGRGRRCKDCGCEDDGYVQPCLATPSPAVEVTETPRGFHVYGDPVTNERGHTVQVHESSNAMGPHVWLGVESATERMDIELDEDGARALVARLQTWLDEIPTRWGNR